MSASGRTSVKGAQLYEVCSGDQLDQPRKGLVCVRVCVRARARGVRVDVGVRVGVEPESAEKTQKAMRMHTFQRDHIEQQIVQGFRRDGTPRPKPSRLKRDTVPILLLALARCQVFLLYRSVLLVMCPT